MPLIVLCGFPSSGKTKICNELVDYLENKSSKVKIISENALVDEKKNEIYSGISYCFYNNIMTGF